MSEDRTFGVNSRILDMTIGKRFVELMSGKGGLGSVLLWLKQLDFADLKEFTDRISSKETFYDTALMKCTKEALKRPEFLREEEIATMLGDVCVGCNKFYSMMGNSPSSCTRCGGAVESRYSLVLDQFDKLDINPTPEGVMMWVAYDELADAYFLTYQAIRKALSVIIEQRGWSSPIQFLDYELKDRLDYSFYYGEPGDQRIACEERQILMGLFRWTIVGIGLVEAEALIRTGVAVLKFGHLFNQLFCSGADLHYNTSLAEFSILYGKANEKYRKETTVGRKEREKRTIEILPLEDKRYYACALLPKDYWITGKLSKRVVLKPIEDLPVYTTYKDCAVNAYVSPSGKGKTTLMGNVFGETFEQNNEFIFNILGDEANSLTLACLPCFPCGGRTGLFLKILEDMKITPHALPMLNLTFLREEEIELCRSKTFMEANPPTVFDRIVDVDEAYQFGFAFENSGKAVREGKESPGILDVLGEFALKMGFKQPCGLVNVRNLGRLEKDTSEKETKPDIEVATVLMDKFSLWRQSCKKPAARLVADEASYLAPVMHSVAGSDTSKSSSTLSGTIKKVRKLNTSFDIGTQKWSEINPDARAEALNIFFRELPQAQDKGRSQRDIVLDSLMLSEGKGLREQVAGLMERGVFPDDEFYWFWWNRNKRDIQVVKPTVPYFMVNQPKKTNREIFKEYENLSGEHFLLDSWEEVKHLNYHSDEYFGRPHIKVS